MFTMFFDWYAARTPARTKRREEMIARRVRIVQARKELKQARRDARRIPWPPVKLTVAA